MGTFLYRIGFHSARRPWVAIVTWLTLLVAGVVSMVSFAGPLTTAISIPNTPTSEVTERLQREFPEAANGSGSVVFTSSDGQPLSEEQRSAISEALKRAEELPQVTDVIDPFETRRQLDEQVSSMRDGEEELNQGRAKIEEGRASLKENAARLEEGEEKLRAGQAQLDKARSDAEAAGAGRAARGELDKQQEELDKARAELEAGRQQLSEGEATIAENEKAVASGEAGLERGNGWWRCWRTSRPSRTMAPPRWVWSCSRPRWTKSTPPRRTRSSAPWRTSMSPE